MLVANYSSSDEGDEDEEGPQVGGGGGEEKKETGPIPPKKVYVDGPTTSSFNIQARKIHGLVKITAPSLKNFLVDEETDTPRKSFIEPSKKKSGLFAILPEPKNVWNSGQGPSISFLKNPSASSVTAGSSSSSSSTSSTTSGKPTTLMPRSLIPDSVKLKRPPQSKLDEIRAKYLKQDANVRIVSRSGKAASSSSSLGKSKDSDDSDEEGEDFFSLDSVNEAEMADPEMLEKLKLPPPDLEQSVQASSSIWMNPAERAADSNSTEENSIISDQKADIMKYLDRSDKNKPKGAPEMNIIDVNAADLRPDTTEWLRNITDQSAAPPRRGKGLGGMQKRKHQITYLAFEAKAREQELQNQWAQNRQSKRQTQQKYGF